MDCDDEDDDMMEDEEPEAPAGPVVDEDGFQMVQPKGRRR